MQTYIVKQWFTTSPKARIYEVRAENLNNLRKRLIADAGKIATDIEVSVKGSDGVSRRFIGTLSILVMQPPAWQRAHKNAWSNVDPKTGKLRRD